MSWHIMRCNWIKPSCTYFGKENLWLQKNNSILDKGWASRNFKNWFWTAALYFSVSMTYVRGKSTPTHTPIYTNIHQYTTNTHFSTLEIGDIYHVQTVNTMFSPWYQTESCVTNVVTECSIRVYWYFFTEQ